MKDALAITVLNLLLVLASGGTGLLTSADQANAAGVQASNVVTQAPVSHGPVSVAFATAADAQHLLATDCKRVTVVNPPIDGASSRWEFSVVSRRGPFGDRSSVPHPVGLLTQHVVLRI